MRSRCGRSRPRGPLAVVVVAAIALVALVSAPLVAAGPAAAVAGQWGTGHWPYSNGIVCDIGSTSVPLVAWTLDGLLQPGYLTSGISETGGVDSGRPPITGATPASDPVLAPGADGAKSAAQLAALSYLLDTAGASADAATVAEVSEIVAEQLGQPTGAACLQPATAPTGDPANAADAADAAALWAQAQQLAGPYHVQLTTTTRTLVLDQPVPVVATVMSAAGHPVPGLAVQFASTGVGTGSEAQTDADGRATAFITVNSATSIGSGQPVELTATVTTPDQLRVRSAPSATPAVYLDPSTSAMSSIALAVAPPAKLGVKVSTSARLAAPGNVLTATVAATGLNGHSGAATVTVAGPVPAPAGGCGSFSAAQWTAAIAAQPQLVVVQTAVSLATGAPVPSVSFTAGGAGCYSVTASLATTDTAPAQTVVAPFGGANATVTVVPITVTVQAAPGGVATDATVAPTVSVSDAGITGGTIGGLLLGPLPAATGSCASTTWTNAPDAEHLESTTVNGAGTYHLRVPPPPVSDCYALDLTITLSLAGLGSVTVSPPPGTAGTVLLLIEPVLQITPTSTWVDTEAAWQPSIRVLGSLTQPGVMTSQLLWLPPLPLGCASGDWARATVLGSGEPVPTVGDGSYPLSSADAARPGCYSLRVTLTLSANAAARSTTGAGALDSLFLAATPLVTPPPIIGHVRPDNGMRWWVALLALTMLVGLTASLVAAFLLRPGRATSISRRAGQVLKAS